MRSKKSSNTRRSTRNKARRSKIRRRVSRRKPRVSRRKQMISRRKQRISRRKQRISRRKKKGKITTDNFYQATILGTFAGKPYPSSLASEKLEDLQIDNNHAKQMAVHLKIQESMQVFINDNGRHPFNQEESDSILNDGISGYNLELQGFIN